MALLQIPVVQGEVGNTIANVMSRKFGTKVLIGKVDLGLFNRLIIDDVLMYDQHGEHLLEASRLSVKVNIWDLGQGKIRISNAQLFGLKANLYKQTASSPDNFQFVLDSLASKDTTHHTPLDLRINSLIIRHGTVKWDKHFLAYKPGVFSPDHLNLNDISTHVIINALKDDSVNINLRKLSFTEQSGLKLDNLKLHLIANHKMAILKDFSLEMPHTHVVFGDITATYQYHKNKLDLPSLNYNGTIGLSYFMPSDMACFYPALSQTKGKIYLQSIFSGSCTSVKIKRINIRTDNNSLLLSANGYVKNWKDNISWFAHIKEMRASAEGIHFIAANAGERLKVPDLVKRLGNIRFAGELGGHKKDFTSKGSLRTSLGNIDINLRLHHRKFQALLDTKGIYIGKILSDNKLNSISTTISLNGLLDAKNKPYYIKAKGDISHIDYNGYPFKNIYLDGIYNKGMASGVASINDPNAKINISGKALLSKKNPVLSFFAKVEHFSPSALKLTNAYPKAMFNFAAKANISGNNLNNLNGNFDLVNFSMVSPQTKYQLDKLHIDAYIKNNSHEMNLLSDFAQFHLRGNFNYATLIQSINNLIGDKLPTLPGLHRKTNENNNNFSVSGIIQKSDWLNKLFNIPVELKSPVILQAAINDRAHTLALTANLPDFSYSGSTYKNGYIRLTTPNDTLKGEMKLSKINKSGRIDAIELQAAAADNKLATKIYYDNNNRQLRVKGLLFSDTQFYKTLQNQNAAHASIHSSHLQIGDSIWTIEPSNIIYYKNHLSIDHFAVRHNNQHLIINGTATPYKQDSVLVNLQDIDVSYILNLVNFHAVNFGGKASGNACVSSAFNQPNAYADLNVKNFTFEEGRMGTLLAHVNYDKVKNQINLTSTAQDGPASQTIVNGYINPQKNDILLNIGAHGTNLEFLKHFCGSFMDQINARGYGDLQVIGPLSSPNLQGNMTASGKVHLAQLNTEYSFDHLHASAIPDEIAFNNDTIYDTEKNIGIITGALYHHNLSHLTYDLNIQAKKLLSYDTKGLNDNSFYGHVFATGNCSIKGKSGETTIDIDAEPEKGSTFIYNVASPNEIGTQDFIHWNDITPTDTTIVNVSNKKGTDPDSLNFPSDIKINFLIRANQHLTLRLLMDPQTGDYITLNGDGVIHANYFNKGAFNMFGTYVIDHGIYKLTIQNIIQKEFQFAQGGTIIFGGDPYQAALNLNAQYAVNGVSLSQLNLGSSFANNNIRVTCMMDITGTPSVPKLQFGLDMPTVSSDLKQMIYSSMNSTEEMNQQVMYLLAVGRFYPQGSNNAVAEETAKQNQTQLAMQSLLSGTLSQQINNVLSTVVHNTNWNLGANISTGNEGWNNAEYEGLLSGQMLNNRLIFNGQFGYRDNTNSASTSFIGDFDLRYLLFPNGNLAVRIYNETNDRYFIKNTLNTQGIGFIIKKDFNGWKDLFGIKTKRKTAKK